MSTNTASDSPEPRQTESLGQPSEGHNRRWTQSVKNWKSALGILAAGFIVYETLSGLAILLLPFSIPSQAMVYVHTVIGLIFLVPCCWYLFRHLIEYIRSPLSHIVVLGYLGIASLLACLISGVVLTVQAAWGLRISYAWDWVHIVTTFATIIFGLFHVVPLALRDRKIPLNMPAHLRSAVGSYGRGLAGYTVAGLVLVLIGSAFYRPPDLQTEFPAGYSFEYGEDRPFAPSLARTAEMKAMDPRVLSGSQSCGTSGCHGEIVEEWQASAHRWAAMDTGFQKIQENMAKQNGPVSTRYCGGCHDPISLFSGTKNLFIENDQLTSLHGYQEGISCLVCHSVREVDVKGNANYIVAAPSRYMFEMEYDAQQSEPVRFLRDFLIRAYPRQHMRDLSKTLFKAPEYCAACHKQFIDKEINRVGWVQLQNQYDNWRQSRWNHLGDATKTIECRECHMPLMDSSDPASGDTQDYNRSGEDGKHRSHRFLASNQFMPNVLNVPGAAKQTELTEQWLQGRYEIPEIADKWTSGPIVGIQVIAPETVKPGEKVDLKLVITSNKVGHDFPTGPLDIIQAWINLDVTDDRGQVIFSTGSVDAKGFIEPGTFMLKAEPVDQAGNLIDRHNLWEMVGVRHRRALFPGFSDTVDFSFFCPEVATPDIRKENPEQIAYRLDVPRTGAGQFTITARLQYRKVSQYLLNFMFGADSGLTSPVTELTSATSTIQIAGAAGRRGD